MNSLLKRLAPLLSIFGLDPKKFINALSREQAP